MSLNNLFKNKIIFFLDFVRSAPQADPIYDIEAEHNNSEWNQLPVEQKTAILKIVISELLENSNDGPTMPLMPTFGDFSPENVAKIFGKAVYYSLESVKQRLIIECQTAAKEIALEIKKLNLFENVKNVSETVKSLTENTLNSSLSTLNLLANTQNLFENTTSFTKKLKLSKKKAKTSRKTPKISHKGTKTLQKSAKM